LKNFENRLTQIWFFKRFHIVIFPALVGTLVRYFLNFDYFCSYEPKTKGSVNLFLKFQPILKVFEELRELKFLNLSIFVVIIS